MNENHERVLRSTLLIIEKQIHQIKSELNASDKPNLIMYSIKDDLDQAARTKILDIASSMLTKISQVKEAFGLVEVKEESVRRDIIGALTLIWVILHESTPEKMENYGRMSASDRELLRPHILALLRLVNLMQTAIS